MKNEIKKTEKQLLEPRPPVIAIMGHIDHGKTTLLDFIRKSAVAEKESGGITQHVSAYEVSHKAEDGTQKSITFIDTPGHEAFAAIRSRGAQVADIAILIVSGEDGVKPQTLEALRFIKESKLPFIVAITKIDKPAANVDRAKQSLLEHEVYVEGYGGETPCVPVSAVSGEGVNDLLDMILLVAEVENFQATKDKPAEGIVLEVTRSKEKGVTATLIVKDGTLTKGATLVSGSSISPLRGMENFLGKRIEVATPGMPISVSGWDSIPVAGAPFIACANKKEAEKYIEAKTHATATKTVKAAENPDKTAIPFVIKGDTTGTLEAIQHELAKLTNEKITAKIIQMGTGDINESDIKIASNKEHAIVFGFNVKTDNAAKSLAERDGVVIETFSIIYKLIERTQEILAERTPKTEVAEITGAAKIIRLFSVTKDKQVIGGKVTEGSIGLGNEFKIMRRGAEVGSGKIRELQQQKVKTSEVAKDREFGALVEAKIEIAPGDVIEAFTIVTK